MHFKSQHVEVKVDSMVVVTDFIQVYLNELDQPIEAVYEFPVEDEMCVSQLIIEVGDRTINAKVLAKE